MVLAKRAFLALCLAAADAALADPLPATDQNPLLQDIGIPPPLQARLGGGTSASATFEWSSIAAIQQSANEYLVLDAETRAWRIEMQHALSDRIAIRVLLPYRSIGGGTLDGFIDNWHALFGQSEGDRPLLAEDALRIDYRRTRSDDSRLRVRIDDDDAGIGDIQIGGGYQLAATPTFALAAWSNVKLPTGDDYALRRNRFGGSLSIAAEYSLGKRWRAFGQLDATYARRGGELREVQREWLAHGLLGLEATYGDKLSVVLQFDGHSAAYRDTPMELLGHAWIVTFGGSYRFDSGWRLQIGVGEDIKVEASPDVNFIFSLAKSWP